MVSIKFLLHDHNGSAARLYSFRDNLAYFVNYILCIRFFLAYSDKPTEGPGSNPGCDIMDSQSQWCSNPIIVITTSSTSVFHSAVNIFFLPLYGKTKPLDSKSVRAFQDLVDSFVIQIPTICSTPQSLPAPFALAMP